MILRCPKYVYPMLSQQDFYYRGRGFSTFIDVCEMLTKLRGYSTFFPLFLTSALTGSNRFSSAVGCNNQFEVLAGKCYAYCIYNIGYT